LSGSASRLPPPAGSRPPAPVFYATCTHLSASLFTRCAGPLRPARQVSRCPRRRLSSAGPCLPVGRVCVGARACACAQLISASPRHDRRDEVSTQAAAATGGACIGGGGDGPAELGTCWGHAKFGTCLRASHFIRTRAHTGVAVYTVSILRCGITPCLPWGVAWPAYCWGYSLPPSLPPSLLLGQLPPSLPPCYAELEKPCLCVTAAAAVHLRGGEHALRLAPG
jgi:hypothetical protein